MSFPTTVVGAGHRAGPGWRGGGAFERSPRARGPAATAVGGALALLLLAALPAAAADLRPVPRPSLDNLEEAVQEQLERNRARLDRTLESDTALPEDRGLAYGEMGQLYFLYDLMAPAEACFANARALDPDAFRWPYYLGVLHRMEGDFAASQEALEAALALQPANLPALLRLGRARLEQRDLDGAAEAWQSALALDPESAAAHHGLGLVAMARGEYPQAVERFERALELQPEATSIHHQLGMAHRELGDLEAARRHLAANRHGSVTFEDPLVDALTPLVRAAQFHFKAGNEALRQGDAARAVEQYRVAVREDPEYVLGRYNLALALMRAGRRDEAEAELQAALELDPDYRDAHYNLASLLAEEGRWDEAAEHYGAAWRIDPQDLQARLEWAAALRQAGRPERALEELEALRREEPGLARARLEEAAALAGLGRGGEAEAAYRALLEAPGADAGARARAHLGLAVLSEPVDPAMAEEEYRAAVELDPDLAAGWLGLGNLLGRGGELGAAAEAFERAAAADPDAERAWFAAATARMLAGEEAAARETLGEALNRLPDSLPLRHGLARLLAAAADPEVRDGGRALELAEQVFESEQTLDHAETLAMALAEAGRFADAAGLQEQAVGEWRRRGDEAGAERARRRLESYRAGEPVRTPWRDG